MNMRASESQHSNEVIQFWWQKVEKMRDWSLKFTYTFETIAKKFKFDFKIQKGKNWEVTISNITPENNLSGFQGMEQIRNKKAVFTLNTTNLTDFWDSLWKALENFVGPIKAPVEDSICKGTYSMLGFRDSTERISVWGQRIEKLNDWSLRLIYINKTFATSYRYDFKIQKGKDWAVTISKIIPEGEQSDLQRWEQMRSGKATYTLDTSGLDAFWKSLWKALDNFVGSLRTPIKDDIMKGAYNMLGFRNLAQLEEQKQSEIDSYLAATTEEIKDLEWNIDNNSIDTDAIDVS